VHRAIRIVASAALLLAVVACSGGDDGAAEGPTSYVALGDSIAAGGGAPPFDPAASRCFRSPEAWPEVLVADDADLRLDGFVACGGATVNNLLAPWAERNVPAQVPSQPDASVGLVTVTIGANDLGYGGFLISCVLGDCAIETTEGEARYQEKLAALRAALVDDLYPALRVAYPGARIVHVGYPRLVTTRKTPLCGWMAPAEQTRIEEVFVDLNRTIADAVRATGDDRLEYLDVAEATDHHELCTVDPWVVDLESPDGTGGHPDADGNRAVADAVAAAL
jgi:lysophospholipase L1-like esterase